MIIEWLLNIFSGFIDWAVGLLGTADPPTYLATITDFVGGLLTSAAGLGAWIPWPLVLTIAGANLGLWVVLFGVKALRWVVGLIPTMGGG